MQDRLAAIDRVIAREVKPLVVKEILFGFLKEGGAAAVEYGEDGFRLTRKTA
jgi:hypothetical protein